MNRLESRLGKGIPLIRQGRFMFLHCACPRIQGFLQLIIQPAVCGLFFSQDGKHDTDRGFARMVRVVCDVYIETAFRALRSQNLESASAGSFFVRRVRTGSDARTRASKKSRRCSSGVIACRECRGGSMSLGEEYPTSPRTEEPFIGRANTPLSGGYADTRLCGESLLNVPISIRRRRSTQGWRRKV